MNMNVKYLGYLNITANKINIFHILLNFYFCLEILYASLNSISVFVLLQPNLHFSQLRQSANLLDCVALHN